MVSSREAGLVTSISAAILREYPEAWIFKVVGHPYQRSGVPDLLVCIEGLMFGLEVKHQKPGESELHARERATPGQRREIGLIRRAGGVGEVVISEEEALSAISSRIVGGR